MIKQDQCDSITMRHVIIPVGVLALTLALFLGFQTKQILRERDALHVNLGQQDKPFEDSQKLQAQLTALVSGTERLAQGGSVGAKEIAEKLKKLGISTAPPEATAEGVASSPAPVPAASEQPKPGPTKP